MIDDYTKLENNIGDIGTVAKPNRKKIDGDAASTTGDGELYTGYTV